MPRTRPNRVLLSTAIMAAVSLLCFTSGCLEVDDPGNTTPATICIEHGDCAVGAYCAGGTCAPLTNVDCNQSGCPEGYECTTSGTCQPAPDCVSDADCCAGVAPPCALTCTQGNCIGSQCTIDATKECYVGCHRGQQTCTQGVWSACDAPPVLETEVCGDDIDNNCDSYTDEDCPECTAGTQVACETPCGVGTKTCSPANVWEPCSAPTDCVCEPGQSGSEVCGLCGFREGLCGPDGVMKYADVCLSEGDCTSGAMETQACGACGESTRVCGDDCRWGEWSECNSGGCSPGDIEQQGCGECGSQTRVCTDECAWSDWGDCDAGGGCSAGETQTNECGMCGQSISTCDNNCAWGPFGACQDEGVCTPLTSEIEDCEQCGTRARSCGMDCSWGPWSSCTGQGVCEPGDTDTKSCGPDSNLGICQMGSQLRTCSGQCEWSPWNDCLGAIYPQEEICGNGVDESCDGADLAFPDQYEGFSGNNSCETCWALADDPEELTLYGSFHSVDDQDDFFCFQGIDDPPGIGSLWTHKEHILVELLDQPLGVDADLHLYKGLANCQNHDYVAASVTIGPDDESIDFKESGDDDSDIYYLRVRNYGEENCGGTYELKIDGLH